MWRNVVYFDLNFMVEGCEISVDDALPWPDLESEGRCADQPVTCQDGEECAMVMSN